MYWNAEPPDPADAPECLHEARARRWARDAGRRRRYDLVTPF